MAIVINGSGTVTGISVGGLPDGIVDSGTLATNSVDSAELIDGAVDNSHIDALAASKLTGALPAIDGSSLTNLPASGMPSGTKVAFFQASAPTGWTQDTGNNDKVLRVVSGTGGGTGGTHALTSPPSLAHTHTGASHTHSTPSHSHSHSLSAGSHTLSESEMPSHRHNLYGTNSGGTNTGKVMTGGFTEWSHWSTYTGSGSSHSHSLSGSITSGGSGTSGSSGTGTTSSTTPTAFAPQYIDVIVCSKD